MASECAVLGTPAIYVNSLTAGSLEEQEKRYGLIFGFRNSNGVIEKGIELLKFTITEPFAPIELGENDSTEPKPELIKTLDSPALRLTLKAKLPALWSIFAGFPEKVKALTTLNAKIIKNPNTKVKFVFLML